MPICFVVAEKWMKMCPRYYRKSVIFKILYIFQVQVSRGHLRKSDIYMIYWSITSSLAFTLMTKPFCNLFYVDTSRWEGILGGGVPYVKTLTNFTTQTSYPPPPPLKKNQSPQTLTLNTNFQH